MTHYTPMISRYFNPRSPHGERHRWRPRIPSRTHFNPRSPHGERHNVSYPLVLAIIISIHAPRMGSDDRYGEGAEDAVHISIHAPRMGSDVHCRIHRRPCRDFNPRSPHGERQVTKPRHNASPQFQSTLPAWGATYRSEDQNNLPKFQSTLPAWGATSYQAKT